MSESKVVDLYGNQLLLRIVVITEIVKWQTLTLKTYALLIVVDTWPMVYMTKHEKYLEVILVIMTVN